MIMKVHIDCLTALYVMDKYVTVLKSDFSLLERANAGIDKPYLVPTSTIRWQEKIEIKTLINQIILSQL